MIETPSTVTAGASGRPALTGYRKAVDMAYGYLTAVFVIAVLVQIYLAGKGSFGDHQQIHAHEKSGQPHGGAFDSHEALGHYLGIAAGVIFILALVAWASRRAVVGALVLVLLTEVAQEGLASGGRNNAWIGGFHAFDAALILGLSIWLCVEWRRRSVA